MNKFIVLGVFFTLWLENVLDIGFSLVPGLSDKNIVLYLAVAWIILQAVLDGRQGGFMHRRHEYLPLHLAYIGLISLAAVSASICVFLIRYPGYTPVYAVVSLKGSLIDHYLMLFVFLAGVRTGTEALQIARVILVAMGIAAIVWLADAFGLADLGIVEREERIITPMGEANQTGTIMGFYVPLMFACGLVTRGFARAFWFAGATVCLLMLLVTASRGAMAGLLGAAILAAWFFRDRIRAEYIAPAVVALLVLGAASFLLLPEEYRALLSARLYDTGAQSSIYGQRSGRTGIWTYGLAQMAAAPLTMLVGFGWKTFSLMNPNASHNDYLELFFNLGVVGLLLAMIVYFSVVQHVRRALEIADPEARVILIAFLLGYASILIAIFFVNLHAPWYFVWSFTGLMLRLASDPVLAQREVPRGSMSAQLPT